MNESTKNDHSFDNNNYNNQSRRDCNNNNNNNNDKTVVSSNINQSNNNNNISNQQQQHQQEEREILHAVITDNHYSNNHDNDEEEDNNNNNNNNNKGKKKKKGHRTSTKYLLQDQQQQEEEEQEQVIGEEEEEEEEEEKQEERINYNINNNTQISKEFTTSSPSSSSADNNNNLVSSQQESENVVEQKDNEAMTKKDKKENDMNNNNNNSSNNNNNNYIGINTSRDDRLDQSLTDKLAAIHAKDEKKVEMQSISKIINRENNLTKSEPSIMEDQVVGSMPLIAKSTTSPSNRTVSENVNVSVSNSNTNDSSSSRSRYTSTTGDLNKAQELPFHQVQILGDGESSIPDDHYDSSSDDDGGNMKKKKKRKCSDILFSKKMVIIYILAFLVLISGVGIIFRIFWPDITIVGSQVLRWALFIDVAILSFMLAFWLVRLFFSLFQVTLYLQQHVYYYINGFVKPLSFMIWAIVCLFATGPILDLPGWTDKDMEKYYTTLRAIIYVSLFYCARVVLVKVLAAKTNRKAFYSTLKESLLNEELLDQMSTRKANRLNHSVSTSLKKRKRLEVTQWLEMIKKRSNLSGKLQERADNYTPEEAKKVAKAILRNADRLKKGYVNREDLKCYVKDSHVDKTYATFGSLYDDMITRDDLVSWVLRVVRARKNLENRLRDHDDIGRVINEVINFIFWFLMFLFVMSLYGVDINVFLVPLSTTILALSFAFGTTLRNVFESLILIFFVRPFEVGDKIVVANEAYFVDRIGILFTSFKSTDGKAVYMPNPILTSSRLENHQRSEEVWVGVDVLMNFTTPIEKLYQLEAKMDKWVKAQKEKWKPDTSLTFVSIQGTNHITVRYGASIIASWQDVKRWRPLKNELFFKMKEWIEDLGIETLPPTQRIQLVEPPLGKSAFPSFNSEMKSPNV
ncbi:putative transmembrane protein [Cavenderia fasciculata]|uniref:Transmembrane protein n=1 Tax=Cavenderia fasciculata TaxID=261658 RepID=F4Q0F5_CACFS|nr:putative transmembrane protein [Cavenderia fasciculata]EGG18306.1 putative transmembrane protein [Cavenderia fasciculata]|eukprot:XP_004357129.1 putative transmembrane protein [Cavenderia fasciculata]